MGSNSEAPSAWDLQNFGGKKFGFCGHGLRHDSSSRNLDLVYPENSSRKLPDTNEGVNFSSGDNYSKEENLIRQEKDKNSCPSPIANLKLGTSADSETISRATSSESVSVFPFFSGMSKRSKLSHQSAQITRCQVEGCNLDLTSVKDYHRRHRICESHSKSPKVIVAGLERRFCQQCSRFHNLCEFDDKKRSCRRRLSDHNARRRRPQIPEAIPVSSTGFLSSIYDGRPQNLHSNRTPTTASNGTWESFCSLKMADSGNSGISPAAYTDLKQQLPLQHLNLGKDASVSSSGINEAPAFPCALSLLSTSSWGLNEPESPSLEQIMQGNISMAQPVMQLQPQNWPIISADHVSKEQAASTSPVHTMHFHSTTDSSQFQDFRSFKTPYEPSFYYSSQIN